MSRIGSVWDDFDARQVNTVSRDLARVPGDVEALAVQTGDFVAWDELVARRGLRRLSVGPLKPEHLEHLGKLDQVQALWLWDIRADHLGDLSRLPRLSDLVIRSAPKLSDLSAIARLAGLQSLRLWDVPRITGLEDLARLRELRELWIETTPSRDARGGQRLATLAPLSQLSQLERLSLIGIAPQDRSLKPLHGLRQLRHVHLPNVFDLAEFAALAGMIPEARGNFAEPVWSGSGLGPCRKCGTEKVMLLGRGTRAKCPACDAAAIAAHVAEFERLKRALPLGGSHSR